MSDGWIDGRMNGWMDLQTDSHSDYSVDPRVEQFQKMYKYAKFDQNIWCSSRIMSIFTKIP